jgi:para-aminobenzoate synthetase component 1
MINNNSSHISQIELDYQPDLAHVIFGTLHHLEWAMLLHSASNHHVDSRYDIIVANPCATLTSFAESTTVYEPSGVSIHQTDPFELISQLTNTYIAPSQQDGRFPFTGGALGYFSYDLGRRIERIPNIATHDISMPDMAIGIYQWAIVIDHKEKSAYLVGDHLEDAQAFLALQRTILQPTPFFHLTSDWTANLSADDYQHKFEQVQEYLLSGDCYQVNLAQRFSAHYCGDEWHAYLLLAKANQAPFSAFLRLPQGCILSVSPERFIELRGNVIETKPIKGTRPRAQDAEQDRANAQELKLATKDQAENLMIVDLLRNDIGRVALPGSVTVPKLFEIESFPAVHHLVSTVRAKLDPRYSAADLLRACFPGGSIIGAPKIRAMEIIEELEPHRRSAYCGSIGYISRDNQVDTSITIRTLIACQGQIYAWGGGGLVADSQSQSEYQETFDKLSRILPILRRTLRNKE